MKKIFLLVMLSSFFIACNPNPSKEARIQELELKIKQSSDQIKQFEIKLKEQESTNAELNKRILALEKNSK